jgi:hypothetical protein
VDLFFLKKNNILNIYWIGSLIIKKKKVKMDPPVDVALVSLLDSSIPIEPRRLLLLLEKTLFSLYGDAQSLQNLKNNVRESLGLPKLATLKKSIKQTRLAVKKNPKAYLKSTPSDYEYYYEDMLKRYPNYVLPLPSQELCGQLPEFLRKPIAEFPATLHPFVGPGLLPKPIQEAQETFQKYTYISHGQLQLSRGFSPTPFISEKRGSKNELLIQRIGQLYVG